MSRRSLHWRLALGSVVWMTAVLFAINFVTLEFVRRHGESHFRHLAHYGAMAMVGFVFAGGGILLVNRVTAPFRALQKQLAEVREGRAVRVEGDYPLEVQPLVDDLNTLLADRDKAIERALTTAGDLAHGLKTPLAIVLEEADRNGNREIRQQIERMQRQIDHQLARARATASAGEAPGLHVSVQESAEGIARTISRLYEAKSLKLDVRVGSGHLVRGRREDLDEMIGNLVDNACKWGRSRVEISSERVDGSIVITVSDDGPGIDEAEREAMLQRGRRADEAAPGSGLGLAIVRDLAELYGGTIELERSHLGGLAARLTLRASA